MTRRVNSSVCFLLGLGTLSLTSLGALAQETCGDNETICPDGFVCKSYEEPCAAPKPDDNLTEDDSTNESTDEIAPCEPVLAYYCELKSCKANSDCPSDMSCHTEEQMECSGQEVAGVACDPDDPECKDVYTPPEEEECTTTTVSQCAPKYLLPCEKAADCGDGFTCEEQQMCQCSSSASGVDSGDSSGSQGSSSGSGGATSSGAEASDAEAVEDRAAENCSCEGTGEFRCKLVETECTKDSNCLDGWTCEDVGNSVDCAVSSDGESDCEEEAETSKLCMPPYYEQFAARGYAQNGGDAVAALDGASEESADDDEKGTAGGQEKDSADEKKESSGGGCSLANGPSSRDPWGLLALLGVGLLLGRRRPTVRG